MTGSKRQRFGVILGPTAVGKTELVVRLVEYFKKDGVVAEIINADSRQIYKGMDIGTAKPSLEQQQCAKHHLLDVVNPDEVLGLAEYLRLVNQILKECKILNILPIIVGGTGQYLSAILENWKIPAVSPQPGLRNELLLEAEKFGVQVLHDRLRASDGVAAKRIHPNNVRRVIRALEVISVTGRPFSTQQKKGNHRKTLFQIGLTLPRECLYERADQRLQNMLDNGFIDEVDQLLKLGYSRDLPSFSALGYREMADLLEGNLNLNEAVQKTIKATHRFIRRQKSWFRNRFDATNWLDWSNPEPVEVYKMIRASQNKHIQSKQ